MGIKIFKRKNTARVVFEILNEFEHLSVSNEDASVRLLELDTTDWLSFIGSVYDRLGVDLDGMDMQRIENMKTIKEIIDFIDSRD